HRGPPDRRPRPGGVRPQMPGPRTAGVHALGRPPRSAGPHRQHALHHRGGAGAGREMSVSIAERLAAILGQRAGRVAPPSGGGLGDVSRADLADGTSVVVKSAGARGTLDVEGWMLRYLAEHSRLPVPRVLHSDPSLLVMEFVEGDSRFSAAAERHAADLLADL